MLSLYRNLSPRQILKPVTWVYDPPCTCRHLQRNGISLRLIGFRDRTERIPR